MGSLGFAEIITILLLALLIFGPKKLPQMGRIAGKTLCEFRKAMTEITSSLDLCDIDDSKGKKER